MLSWILGARPKTDPQIPVSGIEDDWVLCGPPDFKFPAGKGCPKIKRCIRRNPTDGFDLNFAPNFIDRHLEIKTQKLRVDILRAIQFAKGVVAMRKLTDADIDYKAVLAKHTPVSTTHNVVAKHVPVSAFYNHPKPIQDFHSSLRSGRGHW